MRARLVSATVFAAGAALFGGVLVWMASAFIRGRSGLAEALMLGPVAMAAAGGAVGWAAGAWIARAPDWLAAAPIGAGVAFVSTLLYWAITVGGRFAVDTLRGDGLVGWSAREAAAQGLYMVVPLLFLALVVAPLGVLGGVAARRLMRRDDPLPEARP